MASSVSSRATAAGVRALSTRDVARQARSGGIDAHVPILSCSRVVRSSPASASTRSRMVSDIHMPVFSSRSTNGSMRSVSPRAFASMRTPSVPRTSSPALAAMRRACLSSRRTVHFGCSNARASTANSPRPRSSVSHSDGMVTRIDDSQPVVAGRIGNVVSPSASLPQLQLYGLGNPDRITERRQPLQGLNAVEIEQRRGVADDLNHAAVPGRPAAPVPRGAFPQAPRPGRKTGGLRLTAANEVP